MRLLILQGPPSEELFYVLAYLRGGAQRRNYVCLYRDKDTQVRTFVKKSACLNGSERKHIARKVAVTAAKPINTLQRMYSARQILMGFID